MLRGLSRGGGTVIASIHQPSSEVFKLVDLFYLRFGGKTAYFGQAYEAYEFFAQMGFPCPTLRNPSDNFLRCVNVDFDKVKATLKGSMKLQWVLKFLEGRKENRVWYKGSYYALGEMKELGFTEKKLQILSNIIGAFRPSVLTTLMGGSGAGKTTLLDVVAGRKTLDLSSCQNVSHVGLSSLTRGSRCLHRLLLSYGSPVTHDRADSLRRLPKLQSIKLDGCIVTSSGLKTIGNSGISLRELILSKCTWVTNEGLFYLVTKHKELVMLDSTCCRKITDVSIALVTNLCTRLRSLRMENK